MGNKKGVTAVEVFAYIVIIAVVIFGIAFTGTGDTNYLECKSKAKKMGFESDWGPIQGCMIKVHGKWIDINKYRIAE